MKRFVDGVDRSQGLLLPDRLEDYVDEDNPVRVVDAFVEALDLSELGFEAANRAASGRPAYHPGALLKIYIYGYLNRIPSSRRLEREAQRNLELIWLTGRLAPDFKTIADFRKDNGGAITAVCSRFVALCRKMKVFSHAVVARSRRAGSSWMRVLHATWRSWIGPTATRRCCQKVAFLT